MLKLAFMSRYSLHLSMERISWHISYTEAIKSNTAIRLGIDNTPSKEVIANMKYTARKLFEPLRKWHGSPIGISSFYRCPELNKAVGGSSRSAHVKGLAIDIDADIMDNGITNIMIFNYLKDNADFDQLIFEFGDDNPDWVHVSTKKDGNNRRMVLKSLRIGGNVIYEHF